MKEAPTLVTVEQTLTRAIAAYKSNLYRPEYLSEFMQASWNHDGIQIMRLSPSDVVVPQAPYTEAQIRQFMRLDDCLDGKIPAAFDVGSFLPKRVSDPDGLILMGVAFWETDDWALRPDHGIKNYANPFGWMRVDAGLDAPFRGTNEAELRKQINQSGRTGQTLNIYVPSGEAIKRIFDYYPDQGRTWSRLPNSSGAGGVLHADFYPGGRLSVYSYLLPGSRDGSLGGRSFLGA